MIRSVWGELRSVSWEIDAYPRRWGLLRVFLYHWDRWGEFSRVIYGSHGWVDRLSYRYVVFYRYWKNPWQFWDRKHAWFQIIVVSNIRFKIIDFKTINHQVDKVRQYLSASRNQVQMILYSDPQPRWSLYFDLLLKAHLLCLMFCNKDIYTHCFWERSFQLAGSGSLALGSTIYPKLDLSNYHLLCPNERRQDKGHRCILHPILSKIIPQVH